MTDTDARYFERLGRRFGEAQDELLKSHDARPGARARLFEGLPRRAPSGSFRWLFVPAFAAVAAALFLVGSWVMRPAPLSFAVAGNQGHTGQLLSAAAGAATPLRFSDGSLLELHPQARGTVLSVEPNGARVELERGALHASVVHRANTAWAVVAGPFQVAVTGTKFLTQWDPLTRELKVTVQEGSVVVSGGTLREPERVSQGKTLRVSLVLSAEQVAAPGAASPSQPSAGLSVSSEPERAPAASAKSPLADPESFRAVFDSGSPTDLVTLAKELRYRGDLRGSARALLALRSRFPADPRSRLAAQTLTELALARRDCSEARRWLQSYQAEAPTGSMPAELSQRVQACGGSR